jgi:sigma54-dependent transcription regulator
VGETPCVNHILTCPDFEAAMARGEFTEDLYYRLNGVEIRVRPLLERRDEIRNLSRFAPVTATMPTESVDQRAWQAFTSRIRSAVMLGDLHRRISPETST